MTSRLAAALDRSGTLSRLPSTVDGTGWGGDQGDAYTDIEKDIPCRAEITDIDQWTIWMLPETQPIFGDRFSILSLNVLLEVRRIQPWTTLGGAHHHYEVMGAEVAQTRVWTDDG